MQYINFLYPFFLVIHVVICVFLILLVIVQNDKGGGLAGVFGGLGGGAAFSGASTATFLTKLTQGTAIVSFAVILVLNALSTRKAGVQEVSSELIPKNALSSVFPEGYGSSTSGGAIPGVKKAVQPAPAAEPGTPEKAGEGTPAIPGLNLAPEKTEEPAE